MKDVKRLLSHKSESFSCDEVRTNQQKAMINIHNIEAAVKDNSTKTAEMEINSEKFK